MPMFITIGYGDQQGYDRTNKAIRDCAHAHDAALQHAGVLMGVAGPPVLVRNPDAAGVQTMQGPDLADAIEKVSRTPCAVAHGVVEVWPLEQR